MKLSNPNPVAFFFVVKSEPREESEMSSELVISVPLGTEYDEEFLKGAHQVANAIFGQSDFVERIRLIKVEKSQDPHAFLESAWDIVYYLNLTHGDSPEYEVGASFGSDGFWTTWEGNRLPHPNELQSGKVFYRNWGFQIDKLVSFVRSVLQKQP